jgi:4-hydroxy-3-methylbut-2-enyl diphosphate reductase
MLMTESLEVGEMFRHALEARHGAEALAGHYRAFDTICSATQDRQDAVVSLLANQPLDLMIVVGGNNARATGQTLRRAGLTFHIAGRNVSGRGRHPSSGARQKV